MAGAPKKAFALRLDTGLHLALERLAARELRSVNGQIEYLLREALRARGVDVGEAVQMPDNSGAPLDGDRGND